MKNINIGKSGLVGSEIILGCMRIADKDTNYLNRFINTAIEQGINYFDHADIYGNGKSEELFGQSINLKSALREKIIVQSKCGIRNGFFDFSKEHIIKSTEDILKRLNTEYLDVLLLHRPDTLMDPEEVSEAFEILNKDGKVKKFGVSNQNMMQIELLSKYLKDKLIINQLQFSIMNTGIIDAGFNVNMKVDNGIDRDGSILEYCRLNNITIQAWSPFQYGFFEGTFLNNEKFLELNDKINEIANKYNVTNTTIATAWILRHPANMQVVSGTTNIERLKEICKASSITLTREEWYDIYKSAGNKLP